MGKRGEIPPQCRYGKSPTTKPDLFIPSRNFVPILKWRKTATPLGGSFLFFMRNKFYFKFIVLIIVIAISVFFRSKYIEDGIPVEKKEIQKIARTEKIKNSIDIFAGEVKIKSDFYSGQNFFDVLNTPNNKKNLSFSGKNYTGLGFFVTDIGTLHQGKGKYLFYYINGVESSVGVSAYYPKDGDIVEWKLK